MMIDSFYPDWQVQLGQWHVDVPTGSSLFMLIDGVFIPGLFRRLNSAYSPTLLFESLPGCNDDTRDVSPFLIPYDPSDKALERILTCCSGYPMVSAISTVESMEQLGLRLAAWCVVDAGGYRFNFRFPDTRRLPAIIDVLTEQQRRALAGEASTWRYIGRDGRWHLLPLGEYLESPDEVGRAELNDAQFSHLVQDSETDEIWSQLHYLGVRWVGLPSARHKILSSAIALAHEHQLDEAPALRWYSRCLSNTDKQGFDDICFQFLRWREWESSVDFKV